MKALTCLLMCVSLGLALTPIQTCAQSLRFYEASIFEAYAFSTIAGLAGSPGSNDGTGGDARFNEPYSLAVDSLGNVYVVDFFNQTIRKVTPSAVVATLAGLAGHVGTADGTGTSARFHQPSGVAVDVAGNVYVADAYNATIRKVTPDGEVTTWAGVAGDHGSRDGIGNVARFGYPYALAVDMAANIYVADSGDHTVRKVTPEGMVTTVAGLSGSKGSLDGTGKAARFAYPDGIAVDKSGNIFVADSGNGTIRKVMAGGEVTTLAGMAGNYGSADGKGSAARFSYLSGLAVDSAGILYVVDAYNNSIRKVTPAGVVTTALNVRFDFGLIGGGIALDSADNLYVADYRNHTIQKAPPPSRLVRLGLTDATTCPAGGRSMTVEASTNLVN